MNLTYWVSYRPKPAATNIALCSTCDVIIFDQNMHHLYSISAGGKGISNDAQIRVIGQLGLKYPQKSLEI